MSGRKKSLGKKLSRRELDDNEFMAGVREMHEGSDRAAAIIGAVLVEDALVTGICDHLAHPEPKGPLFFDQGAPFGTFANRIAVARAMGFITERMRADLATIKEVRNQFAHAMMALDFDNADISAECAALSDYPYPDMPSRETISQSRYRYEKTCCGMWVAMMKQLRDKKDKEIAQLSVQSEVARLLLGNDIAPSSKSGQ